MPSIDELSRLQSVSSADLFPFFSNANGDTFTISAANLAAFIQTLVTTDSATLALLALKAPIVSPSLTGVPTVPTANPATNNTQAASTAFVATAVAAGPAGLTTAFKFLHLNDERSSGTAGGDSINGQQTRTLNTVKLNEIAGATLGANQVLLPAGTYFLNAKVSGFNLNDARLRWFNVSDGVYTLEGVNGTLANVTLQGSFTITSAKLFELRQNSKFALTDGLGRAMSLGVNEVYCDLMIIQRMY